MQLRHSAPIYMKHSRPSKGTDALLCSVSISHIIMVSEQSKKLVLRLILFFKIQGIVDFPSHLPRSGSPSETLSQAWSSLIISDPTWPTSDHHHNICGSSPVWSPGISLIYGDFSSNFLSSEVGHLPHLLIFQFCPTDFITAIQNYGSWSVLSETSSNSCENSLPFHPHTLMWPLITIWGPYGTFFTDDQGQLAVFDCVWYQNCYCLICYLFCCFWIPKEYHLLLPIAFVYQICE